MASRKTYKCYYCGKPVYEDEMAEKEIPLKTKKNQMKMRRFHKECLPEMEARLQKEREELDEEMQWRKCYEKMRELFGYDPDISLPKMIAIRIKGLRVGKGSPKGMNTTTIKYGYSYDVIYKTILLCSGAIRHAVATVNFKSEDQKINYCMAIIISKIDFVNDKVKSKERTDRIMDSMGSEDWTKNIGVKYKRQGYIDHTVQDLIDKENEERDREKTKLYVEDLFD